MFRIICVIIFKLKGWRVNIDPQLIKKNKQLVLIGAPHTSNWDAVYFTGATFLRKLKTRFMIKKEWMRFPLNLIFRPIGGLAVNNKAKKTTAREFSFKIILFFGLRPLFFFFSIYF